jgi:hypothetical protein
MNPKSLAYNVCIRIQKTPVLILIECSGNFLPILRHRRDSFKFNDEGTTSLLLLEILLIYRQLGLRYGYRS